MNNKFAKTLLAALIVLPITSVSAEASVTNDGGYLKASTSATYNYFAKKGLAHRVYYVNKGLNVEMLSKLENLEVKMKNEAAIVQSKSDKPKQNKPIKEDLPKQTETNRVNEEKDLINKESQSQFENTEQETASNQTTINNAKQDTINNTKQESKVNNNETQSNNANQEATSNDSAPSAENTKQEEKLENEVVSSEYNEFELQVLALTNVERQKEGLKPLALDDALMKNAREKSNDMKINNYFSHTSPTYGSPFDQMKKNGIKYKSAGENIAKGQKTPEQVVKAWMDSPGHRANILNEKYTHLGVGYVKDGNIWTQSFIQK